MWHLCGKYIIYYMVIVMPSLDTVLPVYHSQKCNCWKKILQILDKICSVHAWVLVWFVQKVLKDSTRQEKSKGCEKQGEKWSIKVRLSENSATETYCIFPSPYQRYSPTQNSLQPRLKRQNISFHLVSSHVILEETINRMSICLTTCIWQFKFKR